MPFAADGQDHVDEHGDHQSHPDRTRFKDPAQPGGEEELIGPHRRDQGQSQEWDIGIVQARGEHPRDYRSGGADALGSEKGPGERHEHQHDQQLDDVGHLVQIEGGSLQLARGEVAQGVHRAPENVRPRRAVPEARQHHCEKDVPVGRRFALAIAAERDVDVVAEPG